MSGNACVQTLAIWKVTWRLFLGALPFKLVNDAATFVGPLFLNLLLGVVSEGKSSAVGYSYAGLMFVGLVIGTLCDNQHFQRVMRAGAATTLLLSVSTAWHHCHPPQISVYPGRALRTQSLAAGHLCRSSVKSSDARATLLSACAVRQSWLPGAGYQLRALLVHETFKKVLFISPAVRGEFTSGRVFNLVTSDAETLQLLCQNIMGLISSPLRILVAMFMLYLELGVSSIVALGVLLLLMPTQVLTVPAWFSMTPWFRIKPSGRLES